MAFVTNFEELNQRVYKAEDTYVVKSDDLLVDNSNMSKDMEDGMSTMIINAKNVLSKRKPRYDYKTTNKSFIDLFNTLNMLGIKNNKFFLKIYDTDLIGVNPYMPKLPLELQLKIILECIINPWYYLREICRIPEDGAPIEVGGGVQYQIDRNNAAAWYLFLNGIDAYQSKPRQTGKTQDELAKCVYAYHFGCMSSNFLFFNKDQSLAKTNLYRFKCQRDMLPAFMQMRILINEEGKIDKGIDNITTMRNPVNGNTIMVMPTASSKDSAIKIGRGNTAAFHYYDEFDFMNYNIDTLDAAAFSYSRASENARKNKSLTSRLFSSTPLIFVH